MKIQILSDLHINKLPLNVKVADNSDVVVLAGDIVTSKTINVLNDLVKEITKKGKYVVFVMGNHESYGGCYEDVLDQLHDIEKNVDKFYFLENKWVDINGTRFIGSCLWSNFDLAYYYGLDPYTFSCMVNRYISDFNCINFNGKLFSGKECAKLNENARNFLKFAIDKPFKGKKVVVTHFIPHHYLVHESYKTSSLNPYFVCDCTDLIRDINVWIFGHSHCSTDMNINGVRLISNPKGYGDENNQFRDELVIES